MTKHLVLFVIVLCALFGACDRVYAMGGDHRIGEDGKMVIFDGQRLPPWPSGLADMVRSGPCFHGHWVNGRDEYFFRGDTKQLNSFLKLFSELKQTSVFEGPTTFAPNPEFTAKNINNSPDSLRLDTIFTTPKRVSKPKQTVVDRPLLLPQQLKVVIHSSAEAQRSKLWGAKPKEHYDWKLLVNGQSLELDIWLGKNMKLAELKIPERLKKGSAGKKERVTKGHNSKKP